MRAHQRYHPRRDILSLSSPALHRLRRDCTPLPSTKTSDVPNRITIIARSCRCYRPLPLLSSPTLPKTTDLVNNPDHPIQNRSAYHLHLFSPLKPRALVDTPTTSPSPHPHSPTAKTSANTFYGDPSTFAFAANTSCKIGGRMSGFES